MPETSPTVKSPSPSQTDQREYGPGQPPVPVRGIEDPNEAQHTQDREQKSDQHDADDLQAQWVAARAAERAAKAGEGQEWLARLQTITAPAGVVGLFVSLFFTWKALGEARKSSEAAIRSADALVATEWAHFFVQVTAQNIQMMITGSSMLRDMEGGHLTRLEVTYSVKNFGKTPGVIREHVLIPAADLPEIPDYSDRPKGIRIAYQRILAEGDVVADLNLHLPGRSEQAGNDA